MKDLTRRQKQVLDFIESYIEEKGFPPSVRDIAARFNLVSAAGVHKHIKALVKKNFLSKSDYLSRSLRVLKPGEPRNDRVEIPLAGYVAAGRPIEAVQQSGETLSVPGGLFGGRPGTYALRVRGDSMIGDGILDGDYVVMEPREEAHNGEVVVALINNQEATLKRFYRENSHIRLQPANAEVAPILVSDQELRVQGVVMGIWRRYR